MLVRKTLVRGARTLAHGSFRVHETESVCDAGCREPSGTRTRRRSSNLGEMLLPRSTVGYDVMVYVGLQRYLHHQQRDEIRAALACEHGIVVSTGEISRLAHLFLSYLERLHHARRGSIRDALEQDGGWPLHIDATGEDGRGTLLVLHAGWRKWVLGAYKIPTENAASIRPCIDDVVAWAGSPVAIVRDLGRAMIPACESFRDAVKGDFPILSCHYHFLADVGKDLLDPGHGKLRALFRRFSIRPALRGLARDLGRKLGAGVESVRQAVLTWQHESRAGHRLPEGLEGVGVVRALTQWILDYPMESNGQDFPFVLPYLELYDRCSQARRAVDAFLRTPPADQRVLRALNRLATILDNVGSDLPCRALTQNLRQRQGVFEQLRHALRLVPKDLEGKAPPAAERSASELKDIERDVSNLRSALEARRPERGLAQDTREAIDVVLDHLDRHGKTLWGHVIALPEEVACDGRLVERTNDILENLFHTMKHGERRRSGRKILTQDFEALPPTAALALNLRRPDYVAIVCGTLDQLPAMFAALDIERPQPGSTAPDHESVASHPSLNTATASLPLADRRIVRTKSMKTRILSAARSRAPRLGHAALSAS